MMRQSLYWDDFERRIAETVSAIKVGKFPTVRRVAVFITNACNFKCSYCNSVDKHQTLTQERFEEVLDIYGENAIIHITGGEPSVVPWLYPFIIKNGHKFRFHLNTNAYRMPPYDHIKRLKVSLDNWNGAYWDKLVGVTGAFEKVVSNIRKASEHTVTSITYTLTKENYKDTKKFAEFTNTEFPNLYALFFSVYKGTDTNFLMTPEDADDFFNNVMPELSEKLSTESLALIKETIDEKIRLMKGIRFPQNLKSEPCYLSMSERVIAPSGEEYRCSHLYRDGIMCSRPVKVKKCLYGCNRRLVEFNKQVGERLGAT